MKIHILNCGYTRIHEDLLYGGGNVMTDFRKAVMASDAAVSARSWEKLEPPGFAADPALQFKTLRWVAKEANDTACAAVLCSHDKEIKTETIEF